MKSYWSKLYCNRINTKKYSSINTEEYNKLNPFLPFRWISYDVSRLPLGFRKCACALETRFYFQPLHRIYPLKLRGWMPLHCSQELLTIDPKGNVTNRRISDKGIVLSVE